ncbi:MAG: tetratricopeptide repeat protein [Chlorobi bacterium]|nr:tetratricopeptide repeat protein [Chlorobiota bacterium]MCI0714942.1 tetratricopeptide repeat protein [Chlorobiota bacterium]
MPGKKAKTTDRNKSFVYYIILAVISFAVYANSISNGFVFDDESVILSDPTIEKLSNIPNFFTGEMGFHKVIGAYYRPAVSSSYAIDYALWNFRPFGFHLTNILLHIINTLLFYRLLLLMFAKSGSDFKDYAVLIGAVIFAVHPIHTEVVAWVSGRTDGLSCTFFFAAFIYYLKYSEQGRNLNFALTLLFYLFALFAKEMAITFPVIIILYDAVINKLKFRHELKKKLPLYSALIVLSLLFMLLRWYALKDVPIRVTYYYFYGLDFATVVYTMLQTIPIYFRLSVAPYGMLYHYSGYLPYQSSLFAFNVLFSIVFILITVFVIIYLYKRLPYVSYALVFFFTSLVPVLNIVPTMNFMADRFLYIPSAFLSIAIIALILKYYSDKTANIIMVSGGIVIIIYGYMTISRNADWKTNDDLFLSAEGRPGTVLYVNLGNMYANNGQFDIAEVYYRKALDLKRETVLANNNLGKIFMVKGNFDSAYYYMYKGYLLDTLSPEPMHALAQLYARFDKLPEAIHWLEKMQSFAPNYMNSAQMLQELKAKQQMTSSPSTDTQENKNPDSEIQSKILKLEQSTYQNYQNKNYSKAIEELKELIKINPLRASGYYNNIGMCYLDQQKYHEAIDFFTFAVREEPNFSTGYNNLGQCYEKLGDKTKAIENYQKAVETDPTNVIAKDNLEKLKQ